MLEIRVEPEFRVGDLNVTLAQAAYIYVQGTINLVNVYVLESKMYEF
jgi:hypothetical protein